jgi:hypothetical protein
MAFSLLLRLDMATASVEARTRSARGRSPGRTWRRPGQGPAKLFGYGSQGKCCVSGACRIRRQMSNDLTMGGRVRYRRPKPAPGGSAGLFRVLSLSYHLGGLDRLNDGPCGSFRPRSLHGSQTPLDVTVVGFDSAITVAPRPLAAPLFHATIRLSSRMAAG